MTSTSGESQCLPTEMPLEISATIWCVAQAVDRLPCTGNVISKEWHKEAQQGYQSNARRTKDSTRQLILETAQRYSSHRGGGMSCTHTHTAAQQRQGAPACRQSANVGPPAERHQSASVVPLLRRCKQDSSGCACLAWYTALWVCSVTYRRCFATNAPHCGQEKHALPKQMYHSHFITRVVQSTGEYRRRKEVLQATQ